MARVERGSKEGIVVSAGRAGNRISAAGLYQEPGRRPSERLSPSLSILPPLQGKGWGEGKILPFNGSARKDGTTYMC